MLWRALGPLICLNVGMQPSRLGGGRRHEKPSILDGASTTSDQGRWISIWYSSLHRLGAGAAEALSKAIHTVQGSSRRLPVCRGLLTTSVFDYLLPIERVRVEQASKSEIPPCTLFGTHRVWIYDFPQAGLPSKSTTPLPPHLRPIISCHQPLNGAKDAKKQHKMDDKAAYTKPGRNVYTQFGNPGGWAAAMSKEKDQKASQACAVLQREPSFRCPWLQYKKQPLVG